VQLIEVIRGFLNDVWHLPWFFKLGLLAMAISWAWQWQKAQRRKWLERAAAAWPINRARVVSVQVSDEKKEGRNGPRYWEGLLTYSYALPGQELEVGEHRQKFYDAAVASVWARGLQGCFVNVRVDSENPKRSVWLDEEGSVGKAVAEETAERRSIEQCEEGNSRSVAAVAVFAVAGAGAFFALCIQVSCLRGRPLITAEANDGIFFGMHLGAIACLIAAQALLGWKRSHRVTDWFQTAGRSMKPTGPLKWVSGGYAVVFLYAWVRMAAKDGAPEFWGIWMFSAGWLFFYASAARMCWKALTRTEEGDTVS